MKKILMTAVTIGLFSPIAVFAADNAAHENTSQQMTNVHIRSLAASCAACHGTQGRSAAAVTASLAGMEQHQLESKLLGFKSGNTNATVMHRHAKGLTDDEIRGLAEYFSAQPAGAAAVLNPQKLRADHEH